MNLLSDHEIRRREFLDATQHITGITSGYILATRWLGVVREKNQEPIDGELVLMASRWGVESQSKDLRDLVAVRGNIKSIEEARSLEPGTFRYYLVILRAGHGSRQTGLSPIHTNYLACGTAYATLDEAVAAFEARALAAR